MRIVCVHQGYELYGSDRAFIDSVATLREAWPQADIEVIALGRRILSALGVGNRVELELNTLGDQESRAVGPRPARSRLPGLG